VHVFWLDTREVHLIIVKRIFHYLIETSNFGLSYNCCEILKLESYFNTDYIEDKVEGNNTSEG